MELDYRIENCLKGGYIDAVRDDFHKRCSVCGRGVYTGEDFYDFYGETVCCECEFDYVLKNFHKYL